MSSYVNYLNVRNIFLICACYTKSICIKYKRTCQKYQRIAEVFARNCARSLHNPGSSWLSSRNSVWTIEKIWRRDSIVCSLHAGIIYRCCAYILLDNFSRKNKFSGRNFQESRAAISGGDANNKMYRWYSNKK